MKLLYLVLTCIFLLSFGPFNSAFSSSYFDWNIIIFSLTSLILCLLLVYKRKVLREKNMLMVTLCLVYAGIILVNSLFHGFVLHSLYDSFYLNVAGITKEFWQHQNVAFTIYYIFFPVLFLLQYILIKKMDLNVIIHCFALTITISLVVLFYQAFIDITFLNQQIWIRNQRVGGLSTDPNAFAMTAFLLLPLFISGFFLKSRIMSKIIYLALLIFLVSGIIYSGNRTAAGGVFLLVFSVPMFLYILHKNWPRYVRLVLFVSAPLLIIGTYFILPYVMNVLVSTDAAVLIKRFVATWNKFEEGGITRILEARGIKFLIGLALFLKAPLAGWGPGGFYREYSNEYFIQSSKIDYQIDSVTNHYLMIGGDLGIPAVFFNSIIVFAPLIIAILTLRRSSDPKQRFIIGSLLAGNIIFLILINTIPPSYFLCLIWVWTAQLAYLVIIGENNGISFQIRSKKWKKMFYVFTTASFVLIAIGSYKTTLGLNGYVAKQQADWWPWKYNERNCYGLEQWGNARARWCKNNAVLQISIDRDLPEDVTITLVVQHPDTRQKPVTVRYGGKSGAVHEVVFKDRSWITVQIPATEEHIFKYTYPDGSKTKFFVLSLDVSRTWIPKEWGVNEDQRELGVLVLIPDISC